MTQRILIFSTDDHLVPAGGAEQAFGNIAQHLPDIEFDLICAKLRPGVKNYEKKGNINIYRMGLGVPKLDGILLALFGHFFAYKLMRTHQYDLLWAIMASYGAFAAVRVKRKTGIPLLLTLQEGDSFEHIYSRVRFVRKAFNNIFVSADGIQAISHYLLTWGKEMGYAKDTGGVIPNGVNIEAFTQKFSPEDISAKRASFGFPSDAVVLFTSSRLEKKNGIGDVVSALSALPENVCFVVCGSGSLHDEIHAQVETLGLQKRIAFLGFVDPVTLPLLMQASDIFIRPSLTEGLGNAFLEAMAARMMVIGTDAGGIPDFLADGVTGFVVERNNPASIVSAVEKIQALPPQQQETIKNTAQQMVRKKYSWEVVAVQMKALFNEVSAK